MFSRYQWFEYKPTCDTQFKAHLQILFMHAFTALHCIFFITYLSLLMSMEKKLLLQKRNAMRKTHAEIGFGNLALYMMKMQGCF